MESFLEYDFIQHVSNFYSFKKYVGINCKGIHCYHPFLFYLSLNDLKEKFLRCTVFLILTIEPAVHAPGSSSSLEESAAGLGWSSHVGISAARKENTWCIYNLSQLTIYIQPTVQCGGKTPWLRYIHTRSVFEF